MFGRFAINRNGFSPSCRKYKITPEERKACIGDQDWIHHWQEILADKFNLEVGDRMTIRGRISSR